MRISYSQITTYQRCPHRYALEYVQRVCVPKGGEVALGAAVHAALRFMHEPRSPRLPSLEEVTGEFCRIWQAEQEAVAEPERASLFEDGVDMLRRHYEREFSRQQPRYTADVERFFRVPFGEGHTLTGKIDRIDVLPEGTIEVLDYKTGRGMPTQGDVDRDLQLTIYKMAAQEALFPDKTITTSLYYLRHGVTFTASLGAKPMEEAKEEIREVISGIERGEFSPRVGAYCDRCEYRSHCAIFRPVSLSEQQRADIETLVKELAQVEDSLKASNSEGKRLGARKAELEAAILDWMENAGTGFYEVGNLRAIKEVSRRTSFPPESVRQILEPLGLWERVCRISVTKTAIESLCRSGNLSPRLKRELLSVAETQEKPIVKLRRLGEEEQEEDEG